MNKTVWNSFITSDCFCDVFTLPRIEIGSPWIVFACISCKSCGWPGPWLVPSSIFLLRMCPRCSMGYNGGHSAFLAFYTISRAKGWIQLALSWMAILLTAECTVLLSRSWHEMLISASRMPSDELDRPGKLQSAMDLRALTLPTLVKNNCKPWSRKQCAT